MTPKDPRDEAYLFGDTDLASERLRLLAGVFEPSTRVFLQSFVDLQPRQVLDLGCGPGYTTRLLADVFVNADVRGLDSSDNFIGLARQVPRARTAYEVADVIRPLPGGPYDFIYCRYLLTHLAQAATVLAQWTRQLLPQGLLAVEENDWIVAEQPAFVKYLRIVEAMLSAQGQKLYVGAELDRTDMGPLVVKRSSELVPIATRDRDAARMFWMNLQTWRTQPFVVRNYSSSELQQLEVDLRAIAQNGSDHSSIRFGRRRLVLQKRQE